MSLSDISIKNPVFAWMLMIGLILFGAISVSRMGISQMPDVDFPVVNINVVYEGASPEIIETDVIDIIEDAVMSVEGIVNLSSVSKNGGGSVTVELEISRDVDIAVQEITSKLAQAQRSLPTDMDPPIVSKRNPEDFPIMWLALSSDRPAKEMMDFARNNLQAKYQTVPGVAEVRLGGYTDRNLRIWVDLKKLQRYELSIDDIISTIGKEHVEVPGGKVSTTSKELVIRSLGEAETAQSLEELPINLRGGMPIYSRILLKDVARVEDGLADITARARFNGKPAVGFGIMKQRKTDAIEIAKDVRKLTAELNTKLPKGYNIQVSSDMTSFIKDSTDELMFNLILSAILTGIVCYLFLGSLSSTVNILLAIPTSIMGSFIIIYFLGFTLNTFTLLALSLAIGVVVDDAIMVLENISRFRENGEGKITGAMRGANQIAFAALAASLAVKAIFLPVAFMEGIIGKYFLQFGITISVAVALSLLEALTLTPMRCSQFLDISDTAGFATRIVNRVFKSFSFYYSKSLGFALNHRWPVIIVSLLLFSGSLIFLITIPKEFVPAQDQSMFILRIKTTPGSSFELTNEMTKKVEDYISKKPEVLRFYSSAGNVMGTAESNTAMLFVTMKEYDKRPINKKKGRPLKQFEFAQSIRKDLNSISKDMKVMYQDLSTRGFTASRGYPVEIIIRGEKWDKLAEYTSKIMDEMQKKGSTVDVDSNYTLGQLEVRIYPDRKAAEQRGVSMVSIGNTISAFMGGKKIGKFTDAGHRYDIRISLKEEDRKKIENIKELYVRNNRGELVRISDVVKIEEKMALLSITRLNRERAITIFANPAPGLAQQEAIDATMKIAKEILPKGYYADLTGSAKTSSDSFKSLIFALILGIIISYMILASQFNSYIHPFTILLALPFSFSGAVFALAITGQTINLFSFIGLILLMGLVKKNSILLVEFTNQLRDQGMNAKEALMKACPIRLRPIIMTTLSTIAAAIPPAISIGPGAESRIPMAVAVLGGMIVSTLLTLIVVPSAYSLLSGIEKKKYDEESHKIPKGRGVSR